MPQGARSPLHDLLIGRNQRPNLAAAAYALLDQRRAGTYRRSVLAYRDDVASDLPSFHWRVSELSGTTAEDATANNRDGTYTGSITFGETSPITGDTGDTAIRLPTGDSGDYIERADEAALTPTTGLTLELWVKWDTAATIRDWEALFVKGEGSWRVSRSSNTTDLRLDINGPGVSITTSGVNAFDGNWHHVVAVYDQANGDAFIYVDGVVRASDTATASTNPDDNAAPARVGSNSEAAGREWQGWVDEIALYPSALAADRVASHFNAINVSVPAAVNGPALTLLWDAPAEVSGTQLDLLWDTRAEVSGGALDLLWDLRTPVDGGQLDLVWDLRSQVTGVALDLVWDLAAAVTGGALDLVWDVRAQVAGAALDLLWDLRAAVDGPALDLVWDLLAEGVEPPPPPTQTGAAGGRTFQPRWSEVDGPPLTLRWGSVSSPRAGEGALVESARPLIEEPAERKPIVRLPRRARPRPRPVERPRVPVDAVPLELRWAVRGAVEARVALKWAATEDAMLVGHLQARVAASTTEVARLTREVARAREEAEAAAQGRIQALAAEVARLRDEAESLELLLLSDD